MSVVVANHLHREIVEGLLAAGKHVLCEKPFAPTIEDAEAMVAAARATDRVTGVGLTFRRVSGAVLSPFVTERALPAGAVVGHGAAELSDVREPVENEDLATFTAEFDHGATGTFSAARIPRGQLRPEQPGT